VSGNIDLGLLQSLVQKASRDAEAALAATERLYTAVLPRLDALEARFSALEHRFSGMEHAIDQVARSNHRLETMLADIARKLP
jgi:septal ring factor EnvC (AmiA/AmiB activator)